MIVIKVEVIATDDSGNFQAEALLNEGQLLTRSDWAMVLC